MRTRLYQLAGTIVVGAILLFAAVSATAQTNVVPDNVELAALKAMYDSLGGANWTTKTNWPTAATWPASATAAQMDAWYGIEVTNGDISKITFPQKNLVGKIPAKMGDLKALTVLDLNTNAGITGSLPASLWTITTFREIYLYRCNISGTVSPDIFNLPNLRILNLNVNKLTGSLPSNMGNATTLTSLAISSNSNISGSLPTSIGNLVNLTILQIEGTQIAGSIPTTIGNLTNLTYLKLNSNKLTGSIPTEIGNLNKLVTGLYLNNNLLTGSIPSSIGNLTLLQTLDISTNQLSGSIPTQIGNLTQLTSLVAAYNQLTGSIPTSIGNLTKLTSLNLSFNKLSGELPTSIGNLTSLTTLHLHGNLTLTGSIPPQLGNLTNLTELWMQGNQFVGPIPHEIGNLNKLTLLYLHLNSLSGTIPSSLGNLTNLTNLYLHTNQLTGELPVSLKNLTKLRQFWVSSNQLSGTIPAQFSNWTLLNYFNIGYNQFSGEIPQTLFSAWTQLATFSIEWNAFSGAFPSTISSCTLLTTLNAHYNGFTSLPASMLSLPAITSLMVYNNQLSSIPNFAGQVNKTNLTLNFRSNFLDFSQLEVMVGQGIKSVTLVPVQNIKDVTSVGYQPGDPLIIPARPTGVNSTITWEKQAVNGTWSSVNSINQDATQKTFLRNTPNASDNGYYRWKMTNTLFSGTTLFSEPIYVGELSELEEAKTLYNGLITAASWRTDKVYGVNGSDLTGMYLYDYDEKYQLKEAVFATPNFTASTYVLAGNNYRVGGMEYDPNGNIKKLKRYKGNGQIQHDFGYTYIPNTNQLTSVSSYAGYEYNKIGQTTKVDKVANDGKDQYIDYDVTGKVVAVFEDVNKTKVTTRYTYDDRGFRLTKADYDAKGALTKTYWYIRDASGNVLSIYEQVSTINTTFTDFKQTEVPIYGAGKIGTYYAGSSVAADQAQVEAGTTAYEITDHLGNVRAVLRVQPNEYTATMEDDGTTAYTNPRVRENVYFKNLFETEKRDAQMNHTPDDGVVSTPVPNTSSYLYWINGQAGITPDKKSVGPATALLVNPGDKLDLSAWVRYKIKTSYSKAPLNSIIATVLASSFAFSNGMETVAQATTKFNEALLVNLLSPVSDEPDRPYAYLNYIIFNSNNVAIKRDAKRVPLSAGFDEAQRGNGYSQDNLVKFDSPIVIEQLGYIYIWVSNETENTEVWFDDVSVMHYKGVVTQATEYGAWGEVMREQRLDLASGELTAPLLKDNIQANYKLDGNALDSGPNAMNGTVTGATPTTDRDNQAGKAYSFNGTSKIDLPGTAQKLSFIQNTGVFTFSVFMKVSNVDPTTIYCPVGNAVSTLQKGFYLSYGPLTAGTPRQVGFNMMRGVSGTSIYAKSAGNSINDTNWHHIAVVGDGTVVKIYVDGVQSGTPIAFTGTTGDGTLDVIMGGTRNTNGSLIYGFSGGLDGLLVFDRNLTDEEIAALATGKPTEDIDAETLSQKYRYGYQGKFAERDEETGWNHFELREYDPVIGRWLQFDPKGQHYSPYVGMGNNPVSGIDPDGGWFFHIGLLQDAFNWFKGLFTGGTKKLIGTAKANATLKYEETANLGSNYENRIAQNDESNSPDALQNDFDRASTALKVEAVSSVVEITNDGVTFVSLFTPLAAVETAAARGAAAVSVEGAVWAQTKFSGKFSAGGKFAGQTVEGVAAALRNGNLSAADVPIDVIVRNGQTFILNTRSSAALTMAGIPRSAWKVVNRTGQAAFEGRLTNQLLKNAIPNGTNTIKSGSTILTH